MSLYQKLNSTCSKIIRAIVNRTMNVGKSTKNFEIREDENGIGKVLILKNSWSESISAYMKKHNIRALRLTDSYGFNGHDISFLKDLSYLRSLELYCWDAMSINVIESLPQLEVIGLQCKSSQEIDFRVFYQLRIALVTWSKGMSSLLTLKSIQKLNIQNYPHRDLQHIRSMQSIKELFLTSRKLESLKGIEELQQLELLDLYNCPFLSSVADSKRCPKLKTVEIEACNRIG